MNDKTVDFVLNAVNMVATHGWKLLPQVSEAVYCKKSTGLICMCNEKGVSHANCFILGEGRLNN